jgi:hypothetical protein
MPFRRSIFGLLVSTTLLAIPTPSSAQATTRLVLKDGSYQIVTKYELQGDRVHYYSAERAEWEDVPSDLVNWEATRQYASDSAAGKNSSASKALAKEMEAERVEEEAQSPHVAPGLQLPPEGGVYALDTYLNAPELLPLDQNSGEVNKQVGRNVLRSAINPISGAKRTIELAGPSAKIQIHASLPALYINLEPVDEDAEAAIAESASNKAKPEQDPNDKRRKGPGEKNSKSASGKEPPDLPWDRFRIVRVQVKGDRRIVGVVKVGLTRKVSQQEDIIPVNAEQFAEGWVKLTPKTPLAPGEYALAEILGSQGMNSYVWDFGVHPDAPANLSVIKPVVEAKPGASQK